MKGTLRRGQRSRVPLIQQYVHTDCGPACLLSVLRFWGGDTSLAEIRALTGTDLKGSSLFQLAKAAGLLGFDARGATGDFDDLATVRFPTIAHVVLPGGLLHYVVVERVSSEQVWIMDPARGRKRITREEFEESWKTQAVLLLEPSDRLVRNTPETWWQWIARHLVAEQAFLTQAVFLGAIYTGLGLLTAVFIQVLLDEFIPNRDARALWLAGSLLLAMLLLRAALGYARRRLLASLHHRVGATLNRDFVERLFRLPLVYFERTRKGDITVRLQDCFRVQSGAVQIVSVTIIDGMLVVGALLGLVVLAAPLTWIAVLVLPLYGALLVWSARELHARQNITLQEFTDAEAKYIDSLQGIREVLSSGASSSFAERNHTHWRRFLGALERFEIRQASLGGWAEALGSAALVAALVYGASLVMVERLQLGALIGGYTLLALQLPAIARLAEVFVVFQTTRVSGVRVLDILHVPHQDADVGEPFTMERSLAVEDVDFSWPRGTQQLSEINLTLLRGRVVGLTGANGVGKSTLVKLLRREYEPTSGRLMVDGRDARTFRLSDFRTQVSLVGSTVQVFTGSLFENVTVHRPDITAEQVIGIISDLGLSPFMQRFPEGLATQIGEDGRQISAGEHVIVGLMRALVLQPHVLIVDEAFAMLDTNAFNLMFKVIRRFSSRYAVLLISHDPVVLAHADEVFTLEGGRLLRTAPPVGKRSTVSASS